MIETKLGTDAMELLRQSGTIGDVDAGDGPHEVLREVDRLLAEHGLEVVSVDTGSHSYSFYLAARDSDCP